ncbi:hypothetical protein [Siminovitchia fortis]|nr:hypothetical protein [Siminovitchia fortis]
MEDRGIEEGGNEKVVEGGFEIDRFGSGEGSFGSWDEGVGEMV